MELRAGEKKETEDSGCESVAATIVKLGAMATEKFCLRWNDFEANISGAFRELREDKDFFDVTLACEDEQLQAHKVSVMIFC